MDISVDIEKLETLAKAATPGRWSSCGSYVAPTREAAGTTYVENWRSIALVSDDNDRKFIAAANPAAVLELIAELKALRSQVTTLQAAPDSWQSGYDEWTQGRDA